MNDTHEMQQLETTTCRYSLMSATVSQQPEAPGSPPCQQGIRMTGPGLLGSCTTQRWGLPLQTQLRASKSREPAAASRQFEGQRNEELKHFIGASYGVLVSSHRAQEDQRAQKEGRRQPRTETGKSTTCQR